MASASDNFNRADEFPVAAPWTANDSTTTSIDLVSNGLTKSVQSDYYIYYAGSASSADQFSEATETSNVTNHDWGVAVRVGGAGHNSTPEGYAFDPFNGGPDLLKHVAGAYTHIASVAVPGGYAINHSIRIEAQGTTLRVYYPFSGASAIQTATDSSLTGVGGGAGIFIFDTGGSIDNWSGGDLGGAVASRPLVSRQVRPRSGAVSGARFAR